MILPLASSALPERRQVTAVSGGGAASTLMPSRASGAIQGEERELTGSFAQARVLPLCTIEPPEFHSTAVIIGMVIAGA